MVAFFNERISVRTTQKLEKALKKLIEDEPELFANRSHLVNCLCIEGLRKRGRWK